MKQDTPQQMTATDSEIEIIYQNLQRLEKMISATREVFAGFNTPANKLNPDDYFKNQPQTVCEENSGSSVANKPSEPYIKSGMVLRLNELGQYVKALEQQLMEFNEYTVRPTVYFFERNI